jgi:superfamily II DNA helicase RecQ
LTLNTGFGKSIIFQAVTRISIQEESKRASLIIMPLNLLEEEQTENLKGMAGALNGDTNTKNRHKIGALISGQDITNLPRR